MENNVENVHADNLLGFKELTALCQGLRVI